MCRFSDLKPFPQNMYNNMQINKTEKTKNALRGLKLKVLSEDILIISSFISFSKEISTEYKFLSIYRVSFSSSLYKLSSTVFSSVPLKQLA